MTQQITIEEVKKHKHKSSVWMVIHNDVYDVTSFLEEHPGGEESLTAFAGKDGTQVFEDVNHSEDARELMKKYKIGTLPPEQHNKHFESCCSPKIRKRKSFEGRKSLCSICSASSRSETIKPERKKYTFEPKPERRICPIVVPDECTIPLRYGRPSRPRGFPCGPPTSSNYKWALLALAGALVLGVVLKKYLAR